MTEKRKQATKLETKKKRGRKNEEGKVREIKETNKHEGGEEIN
jgi:hypothetical protein